ncbi:effector binding domain-containing protein [Lysinibacillus sp. MHQ-1]|nr:effector binding domain-containing protein [Lysinibacillus sp. MHQ-1]
MSIQHPYKMRGIMKKSQAFIMILVVNNIMTVLHKKVAPNVAYGISTSFHEDGQFSFIVGEEVQAFEERVQQGFTHLELPAGQYAEFILNSSAEGIQNTRRYIYGVWLPNSNYDRDMGPDFEITDVMQSIYPYNLKMKIYIPIKG